MKITQHIGFKLALLATLLFIASLFLPAVEVTVLQKFVQFKGWQATRISLSLLTDLDKQPRLLLLSLAAMGNLAFPACLWLLCQARPRWAHIGALIVVAGCLALGLLAPTVLGSPQPTLLYGYHVWIGAFTLLLIAVLAELKWGVVPAQN
ncbi:MAG: hypothetical protein JO142_04365 [Burkholderiales bacterium]|nr:hypothetical protein [Burkholderiales bacterium]